MAITFAIATDPLSLGTNYHCLRTNNHTSYEDMEKAYAQDGTFIQEDARTQLDEITAEYSLESGATALTLGSTQAGRLIIDCDVREAQKGHKTMAVQAHKHTDVNLTSTL